MEFDIRDKILFGCTDKENITKLVIPEGIEEIADKAFEDCIKLEEVIMPDSVKVIGKESFAGCDRLKKVTMPENLIEIGEYSFSNCIFLKDIFLKKNVKIIGDHAFAGCQRLKKVTMSEGLEEIRRNAFFGCQRLTSIKIPSSVYKIGEHAFSICHNLESISLPRNLKEIGECAFYKCYKLESILLPMSLKKIGENLFDDVYCFIHFNSYGKFENLKEITLEEGVFEKLDVFSQYISLPSCIKNYYDGKIQYRKEDIKAFKDFLKKYKMKYLKLYLKKEKTRYSQQLFHFTELFRFALYDAAIIPYKYVRYLVDIIDDVEIRHILLEYINQKSKFDVELDRFDIGEFGDEDSKKHKQ